MGLERRLKHIEQEVQKARVRFVIRNWKDEKKARDAIAQDLGYPDGHSLIHGGNYLIESLQIYSAMLEIGELVETNEFHKMKEKSKRKTARRCVEDTYRLWRDNLQQACLPEKERVKLAYLKSRRRAADRILAGLVADTTYLEEAWSTMWQGKKMEAWMQEIEAGYPPAELERWLEERRQSYKHPT